MIIELDDDLIEINDSEDEKLIAIESIFEEGYLGNHAIKASRKLIYHFEKVKIGVQAKSYIKRYKNIFSTDSKRYEIVQPHIRIKNHCTTITKVNSIYQIPIIHIFSNPITQYSLHCENISDTVFFGYLMSTMLFSIKAKGLSGSFFPRGCGGSQIAVETENALRHKKFVVSITDSDKLYPKHSSSSITQECQRLEKIYPHTHKHIELIGRDIENIIPDEILHSVADAQLKDRIYALINNKAIWSKVKLHTDIKHGMTLKTLTKQKYQTDLAREFWDSIKNEAETSGLVKIECPESQFGCSQNDKAPCNCYVLPHFGKDILDHINEKINIMSMKERESLLFKEKHLEQIGRVLVKYFIADNRRQS